MLKTINETELECLAKAFDKKSKIQFLFTTLYREDREIFRTIILGAPFKLAREGLVRNSITDFILPGPSRTDYLIGGRPTQTTLFKGYHPEYRIV